MEPNLNIRPAGPADVPDILAMVKELADYEKLSHMVVATEADFQEALFGRHPAAEAIVAELDGKAVGFSLFFHNFSTFLGRCGIYIEDIYVRPAFRGRGVGKAMLLEIVRLARARDCGRVEWSVLDWNTPAIGFYKGLGAKCMDEWHIFRLDRETIMHLADGASPVV